MHFLIGQEDGGSGRKLPFNQKSELIWSQEEPVLVCRSAGLRGSEDQNQSSGEDTEEISMSRVP